MMHPLDTFLEAQRRALKSPGIAACVVRRGRILWMGGAGWADIARRTPMDPQRTLQNIGSISKTFTATALLQLWEQGKFELDDDVNERLDFPVRHPKFPDRPITYRQLLTHRCALADSRAYGMSYAPGDPTLSLETWLRAYLTPGGRFYSATENFHPWKPGERHAYSNLGFGLLGHLVERIAGEPFPRTCRRRIFTPLGMDRTGWLLSEIPVAAHATPYGPGAATKDNAEEWDAYQTLGLRAGDPVRDPATGPHLPLRLYGFPNYPDGGVRTSVAQLARFLMAYIADGGPILKPETVRLMLTPQAATSPEQGLCWATERRGGVRHWGHNGSDPGVRTSMSFRPSDGVGVICFTNRAGVEHTEVHARLFRDAAKL